MVLQLNKPLIWLTMKLMNNKKKIKNKAKSYASYGMWGQILFGQPTNEVTKVRMFLDALDILNDDDE
mgnify:CR=1 FL=1